MSSASDQIRRYQAYLLEHQDLAPASAVEYGRNVAAFMRYLQKHWPQLTESAGGGQILLDRVTPLMIRGYLGDLNKRQHRTTVARNLAALRSFFRYAVKRLNLPADPTELVGLHRREARPPAVISSREMQRLLDGITTDSSRNVRNRALLEVLYATGIRLAELISLTWQDLDLQAGTLTVPGRGTRFRRLPLGTQARAMLQRHLGFEQEKGRNTDGAAFVFANRQGCSLTARAVSSIFNRLGVDGNLPVALSARAIRRAVAAHLLEAGADLELVQQFMGHKHATTTRRCLASF